VFEQTFTGDAYYLAFSTDGRLAVASSDGAIHLYSIAGGRVAADGAVRVSQADPRGVQFSPDGRLLAVGYLSRQSTASVRVDVFDVGSRQLTRAFVFSDVSQGNLMNVTWRRDGRALYAAGTGYRGRLGLYEVLKVSEGIRSLALRRATPGEIAMFASAEGMTTLREDGLEKVRLGITSVDEVIRVTGTI